MDANQPIPYIALWDKLLVTSHLLFIDDTEFFRPYGITPPQYFLLFKIHENEGLNQQLLANEMRVTKGNVSQMLKLVEKKGLVKREKKGNAYHIFLTDKSRQLLVTMLPEHDRFVAGFFQRMEPEQREKLFQLLDLLYPRRD